MGERVRREQYPWWVKASLWGLPNRSAVWAFVWLSVVAAAGATGYLKWVGSPRWYVGPLFLLAALMYWLSIRWMDQNGSWEHEE